tara:strand:- start:20 stop:202 length:183 start_codon:yes stop_codon:yes gene_type:complete
MAQKYALVAKADTVLSLASVSQMFVIAMPEVMQPAPNVSNTVVQRVVIVNQATRFTMVRA